MNKKLFPLLLGGLGIGMTEFVMMGLLPDVAENLKISIPAAGHLISAYALGVVIGAPLLVIISGSYPPKKILMALMGIFTLFNGLSAFAPNEHTLLVARFFAGLPHGAFFGVGAIMASRLAEPGKQAQAVATMFAGLTIANLALVPIGTWIGHNFLWRYTFGLVAVIGLITIFSIKFWLPAIPAEKSEGLRSQLKIFQHADVWLVVLITAIGTGGLFCWISYIAPLMTEVSGFAPASVPLIMVLAGFGMVIGNWFGAKLADNMPAGKACAWLLAAMTVTLLCVFLFSQFRILSLVLTFVAGALSISLAAPIQILMMQCAKDAQMLGASITQAGFNIGNSLGAFLGGLPITYGLTYNYPSLVGMLMAAAGVVFALMIVKMQRGNPLPHQHMQILSH